MEIGLNKRVFKVVSRDQWQEALAQGSFRGAEVDLADGFIHLSDADQVVETVEKHFKGQKDLLLVAFDASELGNQLRWEVSRGGDLFPHLYENLPTEKALQVQPLIDLDDGNHRFPESWR